MSYPASCFTPLVSVKGKCVPATVTPYFWLDDIAGIDLVKLASVAEANAPSGSTLADALIDTAARFVAADVEAIYDGHYKVENTIVTGCSACSFLSTGGAGPERGGMVKSLSDSRLGILAIESFVAKVLASGTFHVILDDGIGQTREIEHTFVSGNEYEFRNVNFTTKAKQVRIYLQEEQALATLSCPGSGKSCGCSGRSAAMSDLVFTGTQNGAETSSVYGFLPCATVRCDPQDLLCYVANSAPNMVGMALLYKAAQLYFERNNLSERNNRTVSVDPEQKVDEARRYEKLYLDKLNGKGTRGLKDLVNSVLGQTKDVCVVCTSKLAVSWAST